jgi:hypothetical protein
VGANPYGIAGPQLERCRGMGTPSGTSGFNPFSDERARVHGFAACVAGAVLPPVVWLAVGPWDLSTVSADGQRVSEAAGSARVFAVLAVVDVLVAVGTWRRWVTPVAATIGAGIVWTAVAFTVTANARVSGANMAALWLFFGPVVVTMNTVVMYATISCCRSIAGRDRLPRRGG